MSSYPTDTPNDIIENPKVRKTVYQIIALASVALAATNAGFGVAVAVEAATFPLWLAITNAVFPVVAGGLGYVAQRNTPTPGGTVG
jgi:hypothetical protein